MHTSEYIQWTGHINMTALNLQADDTGGELGALDPLPPPPPPATELMALLRHRPARRRPARQPFVRSLRSRRCSPSLTLLHLRRGGIVFSTGLPSAAGGDNSTMQQVISWNNFVGSGIFCLKLCGVSRSSSSRSRPSWSSLTSLSALAAYLVAQLLPERVRPHWLLVQCVPSAVT